MMHARAGAHFAIGVQARVKSSPSRATRSNAGVLIHFVPYGLACAPQLSAIAKRMFGRASAACEFAIHAPGIMQRSRRNAFIFRESQNVVPRRVAVVHPVGWCPRPQAPHHGTLLRDCAERYFPIALKAKNARTARPKLPPISQTINALPAAATTGTRMSVSINLNGWLFPWIAAPSSVGCKFFCR